MFDIGIERKNLQVFQREGKIYNPIDEKTSKLFEKETRKNRKTFVYAPSPKGYVEDE